MASFWKIRNRRLSLARPVLMGILNVTPDSFSDGGAHAAPEAAARAAQEMLEDGADVIDLGGESTRPGAAPVDEETELRRVLPAVQAIRRVSSAPLSVDTRRASVARAALEAGADIVNDVSALADPGMAEVVRQFGAGLVLMHGYAAHAARPSLRKKTSTGNAPAAIAAFLRERLDFAVRAGIDRARLVADPGLGFAKTTRENVAALQGLPDYARLGVPVLIGPSRKRFVGELTSVGEPARRVSGSIAAMLWALWHGASILRMHDVRAAREAIDLATALAGGK